MDDRFAGLSEWLTTILGHSVPNIEPLSNDASARRYFALPEQGLVAVDTPLPYDQNKAFLTIAKTLGQYPLHVPQVFRYDLTHGYMLMSDLGRQSYLSALSDKSATPLYAQALDALHIFQTIPREAFAAHAIPHFDKHFILKETQLCQEWFFEKYLQLSLEEAEQKALQRTYSLLILNSLEQPHVLVHRDYHSRNLMVCPKHNPGIIDFQDAVWGAVTYDLVSLLRDCYIAWPLAQVEKWVADFQWQLQADKRIPVVSAEQFLKWFDLMGVQRHLKALGIFARLALLYQKPGYLKDMPRTLNYIVQVCEKYPELQFLNAFIEERVMPQFARVPA